MQECQIDFGDGSLSVTEERRKQKMEEEKGLFSCGYFYILSYKTGCYLSTMN